MTKRSLLLLPLLVLVFIAFSGIDKAYSQNMPGVSVWTDKKAYSPGESGVLYIKFKTDAHTKIPKEPEITVTLNGDVTGAGMQDYTGGGGDYLSNNTVKYNFTVPSGSSGNVKVAGSVKFGYCNSENGVCKIGNKSFSVSRQVK